MLYDEHLDLMETQRQEMENEFTAKEEEKQISVKQGELQEQNEHEQHDAEQHQSQQGLVFFLIMLTQVILFVWPRWNILLIYHHHQ